MELFAVFQWLGKLWPHVVWAEGYKWRVHMQHGIRIAAIAILLIATKASAQSGTLDFETGTDQGFGTGFGNDASATFPIVNIGGSNRKIGRASCRERV